MLKKKGKRQVKGTGTGTGTGKRRGSNEIVP
jgi:hypothetical protein